MASNTEFYVKGVFILLAAGGGLLYSGWKRRTRARLVEDTPRSKLATAPQGLVEVEGFAWPDGEKFLSSVSGSDVVYYEFALQRQETKGSGKNSRKEWVTVYSRKHDEVFYICDPTGIALVDPRGADFELKGETKTAWGALPPDKRDRVFKILGAAKPDGFPPSEGFFGLFAKPYRVVEREIRIGSPLYVTGQITALSDPPLKTQQAGLTRFTSQTMDAQTRELRQIDRLLDKNGDGQISSDEARDGYAAAAQLARSKAKIEPTAEREFEIWGILQESGHHKLFIADDHEKRLVAKLKKFVWLQLASGVTCLTVAICTVLPYVMAPLNQPTKIAHPKKITRQIAAENESREDMNHLHVSCLKQHARLACEQLLNRADEYQLSDAYKKYYRDEACRTGTGTGKFCDTPPVSEPKP